MSSDRVAGEVCAVSQVVDLGSVRLGRTTEQCKRAAMSTVEQGRSGAAEQEASVRNRVCRLGRFGPWGKADPGELSLSGGVLRFRSDARGLLFEASIAEVRFRIPKRYFGIGLKLIVDGRSYPFWFVPMTSMTGTSAIGGGTNIGGNSFPLSAVGPAKEAVREWKAMLQTPTS